MKTIQVTPEEMQKRLFCWEGAKPITRHDDYAPELKRDVVAERLYGVITSNDPNDSTAESNLFDSAPILSGVANFAMSIISCPPRQGPVLHVHHFTYETFTIFTGKWKFDWGDNGEHTVTLEHWDTISFPPGVPRRFENASDDRSYMQVVVYGEGKITDDIAMPAHVEDYLVERHGREMIGQMKERGASFTAGQDGPVRQPARR